jgi:thymidine phosphorylase
MSFNIPSIIESKRDGETLTDAQINFIVQHIADADGKNIHAVQLGAFLMAVYLKGMNTAETISLTKAMIRHGETLEWPEHWKNLVVDKHSTGGVGDKVSLPLAPVLAAFGLKVPMISGRGLGFTG